MEYRALTEYEIQVLTQNGCRADDWLTLTVTDGFDPDCVRNCQFTGSVQIGAHAATVLESEGKTYRPGIRNAWLENVAVGDNCHIANVGGRLANLDIGEKVIIEHVGSIVCQGESTFGNGHAIEVLNEGSGREVKITAITSAQTAYLACLYRQRKLLVEHLDRMADDYAATLKSGRATIGNGARISDCRTITNVLIGNAAVITGAERLQNGTVVSTIAAPTIIGSAVIAENFIIQQGASVKEGALISGTLIGEATKIGKQFSAENSTMFANSDGFHSEVCSIFGGPYSVTHHRSTLLIAGMFSFFNAGSATNQSNHMYKLGPVHQGILERGCKTGSGAYLLWPARVGAFSAVMGKHYANFDTSDFPFSYIDIDKGRSTLIPAMNFLTVGTVRDGLKWPVRDRRKNSDKLDLLIFEVLSPYTAQKMIRGHRIMDDLYEKTGKGQESVIHNGIHIKRLLLKTCRRYYRMALDIYFGELLLNHLRQVREGKTSLGKYDPDGMTGDCAWIDVAGLLCRQDRLEKVLGRIEDGRLGSLELVQAALSDVYTAYKADEWNWF
ncbi:MAG: DUF4954 family protein, partial [Candidatus Neomarinimicrobiota bacterium]